MSSEYAFKKGSFNKIIIAACLITIFMIAEVVVGIIANSIALLADAGHTLTDAISLVGVIWTAKLSAQPATTRWTYGLSRSEIVAAAINGISLLVVAGLVVETAIRHLISPPSVSGMSLMIVASLGAVLNIIVVTLISDTRDQSLNARAAFLHVATDLTAFLATLIAGIVISVSGFERADPIASLVAVALIIWAAYGLLRDSSKILLEGVPENVDLNSVRDHISQIQNVVEVHDLHAWTLTTNLPVVSAHVVVTDISFQDGSAAMVLDKLQECLMGHFDVEHSTFQLEPKSHKKHEADFHG